ncbi:hypothetical protein [Priestia megaterium]|uniref:hypothetical protein n=1 Tax=Priestia megaterium TaxID=1404 RepID=UPI001CDD2198|nr:hypothetical protein [Priestia megaterium]MCA4157729.1 hypothetical protein [Priestia megaterium]
MSSIGLKMRKLQEQMNSTEGWRITNKIRIFSVSVYTFQKNNEEIEKLLNLYETNTDMVIRIMSVDNRKEFEYFLQEVTRLLHNYLAAAKTLIDHTRKLFQDEYKGTDFEEEYNNKIKELFINSSVSKFIQDLRNYSLHRTLPITGANLSFNRESGMSHSVHLAKESLIGWEKWTKKASEYLNNQGDKISLLQLIKEYTEIVIGFQKWFQEKQYEIHSDSLKELEKLQEEYNILYEQIKLN